MSIACRKVRGAVYLVCGFIWKKRFPGVTAPISLLRVAALSGLSMGPKGRRFRISRPLFFRFRAGGPVAGDGAGRNIKLQQRMVSG